MSKKEPYIPDSKVLKDNEPIKKIIIGSIVFVGVALIAIAVFYFTSQNNKNDMVTKLNNGLIIENLQEGTGQELKDGDTATFHYTGTLEDGTKFDSSLDRGEPFTIPIGQGFVIQGWEEGLPGMKVGGRRKLTIPPELGYGETGAGNVIPPNATLIFEVELLEVSEDESFGQ